MNYIRYIANHILDIVFSIFFNFKILPLSEAIHVPILLSYDTRILKLKKGSILIPKGAKTFSIKMGIEGVDGISPYRRSLLCLENGSVICFKGRASISKGFSIRNNAYIEIGEDFYSNCNLSLICNKKIVIGKECVFGWNVHIRDCDGHPIYINKKRSNVDKEVFVGRHVWIGQDAKILKGSCIPNDCVIAINSCVTGPFTEEGIIIGGYPAKKIKDGIEWRV